MVLKNNEFKDIQLLDISVKKNTVEYSFRCSPNIRDYFPEEKMYIEYSTDISKVPKSILAIPFVSNVLPLVWMEKCVLWVEELDRTFYDSIFRLKSAYQELYPNVIFGGRVVSAKLQNNIYNVNRESALLFSGGIDAHVSYLRIKETNPLLCNIQGWYNYNNKGDVNKAAEQDKKDIEKFSKSNNLQFEFVKSNFARFIYSINFDNMYKKSLGDSLWHGFQHSMNFISICIPIAYLNGIRNIYIASSFNLGHFGTCASYPTTDIEFKFATYGGCVHDAFELSRQEKVHYLVEYQKATSKPYPVRVCSFNDVNCCKCDKCFRSILEIVAENGNVKEFGFDIQGELQDYFENIFEKDIINFDVEGESRKHWPDTIKRMKENYKNIKEKKFVDWFLNYDFLEKRKKALRKYYKDNFWTIIRRKITEYKATNFKK